MKHEKATPQYTTKLEKWNRQRKERETNEFGMTMRKKERNTSKNMKRKYENKKEKERNDTIFENVSSRSRIGLLLDTV